MHWETIIGLEVHAQLKTQSKLFSSAPNRFGAKANESANFIDAGFPGILPVLNHEAVVMALKFGFAINAEINDLSIFERKNYFYPDLPKGYQISQYQCPIIANGYLDITTTSVNKRVMIVRAHLEEDAGKSVHDIHPSYTGIDLNRAGTPLLEIVSSPCLSSAHEVISYLKTLHQLLRFLHICDGNMQEGSFRCDVNISLRPIGQQQLGTRTELKNLNSFKYIEQAITYEQSRQQTLLENGEKIIQETRWYSPDKNATYPLRGKENEHDYRYFPDPDLLPIKISIDDLNYIKSTMPPLPSELKEHLQIKFHLNNDDTEFLLTSPAIIDYFQKLRSYSNAPTHMLINWLRGTYLGALNAANLDFENAPVSPLVLANLLNRLANKLVSVNNAKLIFMELFHGENDLDGLFHKHAFVYINDQKTIDVIVRSIIASHPQQANEFRQGKEKLLSFFIGMVMKETKGQADPAQINTSLKQHLG
ncbi:MAG: Asp-tRNA(Asn)/Glu-tRNA(Gln) amidotransferase subunit GatB [Legionella sp.]